MCIRDRCITQEQIEAKLRSLKIDKSPGPDLLDPRILYEVRREIAEPLKEIFDASLKKGKIPEDWKTAVVTANNEDSVRLQEALEKMHSWSEEWLLELNISKCKVLPITRGMLQNNIYTQER